MTGHPDHASKEIGADHQRLPASLPRFVQKRHHRQEMSRPPREGRKNPHILKNIRDDVIRQWRGGVRGRVMVFDCGLCAVEQEARYSRRTIGARRS